MCMGGLFGSGIGLCRLLVACHFVFRFSCVCAGGMGVCGWV